MRKDTPRPFTHPFQDEHSGSLCPHPLRVWRASACHRSGPDAFGGSERQRTLSGPGCIRVRCRGASAGGDRSHLMRLDDRRCLPVQCCTIFTIRARTWGRPTRHLAASSAPPPRTIIALRPLPGVLGWQGFQLARRVDGGSQRTRLPKNHRPMREHLCLNWHKPAEVFRQSRHPGSRPGYPTLPHACRASSPRHSPAFAAAPSRPGCKSTCTTLMHCVHGGNSTLCIDTNCRHHIVRRHVSASTAPGPTVYGPSTDQAGDIE